MRPAASISVALSAALSLIGSNRAQAGPGSEELELLKQRHLARLTAQDAASTKPAKTIPVDCAKGRRIQDAIDGDAGPLVVEIQGICRENVRIRHKTVTLRGVDPDLDGIRGVVDDPQSPVVWVQDSEETILENLSIGDGPWQGVRLESSVVTMRDCIVGDNADSGIVVTRASELVAEGLTVSDNARVGLNVTQNSFGFCVDCTFSDNAARAVVGSRGGFVSALDSVITGPAGVAASADAYADLDCITEDSGAPCSLHVTGRAAQAGLGATAALLIDGEYDGAVFAFERGNLWLVGARQATMGVGGDNVVANFSTLNAEPWGTTESRLRGTTHVSTFGRALLVGGTEIDGDLTCDSAGDAWVDAGVVVSGGAISGCEHAPWP